MEIYDPKSTFNKHMSLGMKKYFENYQFFRSQIFQF